MAAPSFTAATVFERLGMKPKVVYIEQRIAMEKMKAGEIDAVIVCGGGQAVQIRDAGSRTSTASIW